MSYGHYTGRRPIRLRFWRSAPIGLRFWRSEPSQIAVRRRTRARGARGSRLCALAVRSLSLRRRAPFLPLSPSVCPSACRSCATFSASAASRPSDTASWPRASVSW
eukprot:8074991-Pyramimonas_sp.AAC.1